MKRPAIADPRAALTELRRRLRRVRADLALGAIRSMYLALANKDTTLLSARECALWPATINGHQMAFLARELIENSNDHRGSTMDFDEYRRWANLYNTAQGLEMDVADPHASRTLTDWELFFLRTAHQQFRFQQSSIPAIPRTLALFGRRRVQPNKAATLDIPAAFQAAAGMPVRDSLRLLTISRVQRWAPVLSWTDSQTQLPTASDSTDSWLALVRTIGASERNVRARGQRGPSSRCTASTRWNVGRSS